MKIAQLVPSMESGGVERGCLEISSWLRAQGHEALVVSGGGRLVQNLERSGSRHHHLATGMKNPKALIQALRLRRWLKQARLDILHVRSRMPAWVTKLALAGWRPSRRPRVVTTVHGLYSVSGYSRVMTSGEIVICVSEAVREYVLANYRKVDAEKLRVIPRGIDPGVYFPEYRPDSSWWEAWGRDYPQTMGKRWITLPGRVTRLKGHAPFLRVLTQLEDPDIHGVIVGDVRSVKQAYALEMRELAQRLGVADRVTWVGHRDDLRDILAASSVVVGLSTKPEAFGRTSLEALALGKPVVAFDHGGAAEVLRSMFPNGLVALGNEDDVVSRCRWALEHRPEPTLLPYEYTLEAMLTSIGGVYQDLTQPPHSFLP